MNEDRQHFFIAGGTLSPSAPSYVARPADGELRRLASSGELCYVLTTRQMGKSSLIARSARQLQEMGIRTAIIDLTLLGSAPLEPWLLSFMDDLSEQLGLSTEPAEWWEERDSLSHFRRFTKFITEVLPVDIAGPAAIFIDEVDKALDLDFSDDFFAAVRAIHNQQVARDAPWRVSFVLAGVATPTDLIKDPARTPFNVGSQITLEEFEPEDARPVLSKGLPPPVNIIVGRIFYWTGGHPYLTQKIARSIAQDVNQTWTVWTIDDIVTQLFLTKEAQRAESNLDFVRKGIVTSPDKNKLLALYSRIYKGRKAVRSDQRSAAQNELKLYGLVRENDRGILAVRNNIYRQVFNQRWIKENTHVSPRILVLLATAVVAFLLAAGLLVYFLWLRPTPDEVIAQSYIREFQDTTNPTIRLNSLANLFALPGYEEQARDLFSGLQPDEQVALFANRAPDLLEETAAVVQGTYATLFGQDLNEMAGSTRVLQAMLSAISDDMILHLEISQWLEARTLVAEARYPEALDAYNIALITGGENLAVRFERGLVALVLEDYATALADLEIVFENGLPWEERVEPVIETNPGFLSYLANQAGSTLAAVAIQFEIAGLPATATATPTFDPETQPVAADTPTPTPIPQPEVVLISRPDLVPDLKAKQAASPPAIDGELSDWVGIPAVVTGHRVYSADSWDGSEDLASLWRLSWDNDQLYAGVRVFDDFHVQTSSGTQVLLGDSLELQIDAGWLGGLGEPAIGADDFQLLLSPGDFAGLPPSAVLLQGDVNGEMVEVPGQNILIAARRTRDGYAVEAAVPWADLSLTPQPGLVIGLVLNANDNDVPGTAVQEVMMSSVAGRIFDNPATWGTLVLQADGGDGALVAYSAGLGETPAAPASSTTRLPSPERVTVGQSAGGEPIEAIRFGGGPRDIILVGGLHAGYAPSTVTVARRAVAYFTEFPDAVPDGITLYIIESANPDSPYAPGKLSGRLNANSVDLNRNWDCDWRENAMYRNDPIEGLGGPASFSEPETKALWDFILTRDVAAVIFWEARAFGGLVSPGACGPQSDVSNPLAEIYGTAADYKVANFEEESDQILNGDGSNWLDDQGIPAMAVLLPDYVTVDWENNLAGILAVLQAYGN